MVLVDVVDRAVETAGREDLLATLESLDQLALALRSAALGRMISTQKRTASATNVAFFT